MRSLETIRCLPKNLPEFIEIDISQTELDKILHLSDIALPQGVEILALSQGPEHNLPIASLHKPKRAAVEEEVSSEGEGESEAEEKKESNNKEEAKSKK